MAVLTTAIKVLIGLALVVPILVAPGYYSPYIVPKVLVFRSVVELMLGVYLILVLGDWDRYKVRLSPISVAIAIFTLSLGVSTLVGVDWHKSFFGTYAWMLGFDTLVHYVAFYFIATTVLTRWTMWKKYLRLFLGVAVLVLAIGVVQKLIQVLMAGGSERVIATLGNATYLGGLGGFTVWLALLLGLGDDAKGWRFDYCVAGLFGIAGVMISESRGALLAIIVGLVVLLICYTLVMGKNPKWRRLLVAGLGVCAIPLILVIVVGIQGRTAAELSQMITRDRASLFMKWADATQLRALGGQHDEQAYANVLEDIHLLNEAQITPTVQSLNAYLTEQGSALDAISADDLKKIELTHLTIENRDRPIRLDRGIERRIVRARWYADIPVLRRFGVWINISKNARFMAWGAAVDAFMERPVLGWGPNNFEFAYNKYYQPEYFGYPWSTTRYDNAHNVVLNTLAEQGAVGLASYLFLVGSPVVLLWRGYRRGSVDVHLAAVGTAFFNLTPGLQPVCFREPNVVPVFHIDASHAQQPDAWRAQTRHCPISDASYPSHRDWGDGACGDGGNQSTYRSS